MSLKQFLQKEATENLEAAENNIKNLRGCCKIGNYCVAAYFSFFFDIQ